MTKSYLFVYNDEVGTRDQVKEILNRMKIVVYWRYDMPNLFYVVSNNSAFELASEFEKLKGTSGRFIFSEYNGNAQGRLTGESWYLLNNKIHEKK
jgi:hypothetical protein